MISVKQDFINLIEKDKDTVVDELTSLQDFDDRTATLAVEPVNPDDPEGEWVTEEIENPLPLHRQKGFEEWLDVVRLNAEAQGVKVSELTGKYSKTEIEAAVVVLT
jgi:hypothetical protein